MLRQETHLDDKEFKHYMKYFLNFPKDDTVSVAKCVVQLNLISLREAQVLRVCPDRWNTLTRLFGPYRKFYQTLHRYVIGTGFLGLINRIRAEVRLARYLMTRSFAHLLLQEILKEYPNHVLIRFSRTAPLLLVPFLFLCGLYSGVSSSMERTGI